MKKILSLFLCLAVLVSCFCFTTASAAGNLSTDKTEYGVGEPIMVTAKGSGDQWVGIYPASDPTDGSKTSIYWYYVSTYGSGNAVNIKNTELNSDRGAWASIPIGEYKVVLYADGGYRVAEIVNISVVSVDASNTTYDLTIDGQTVENGEVVTVTSDDFNLIATADGPAGEAWVGLYHAYYNETTPYENADGNQTAWKYVSDCASGWNLYNTLWWGRTTVVLFGDGGYSKVLKVFYIQFNANGTIDTTFNGKEIANNARVKVYKDLGEKAILNISATADYNTKAWTAVYTNIAGNSEVDYTGYGYGDWDNVKDVKGKDFDITSKLADGRNTFVIFGSEKQNDIRKCIVIDYVNYADTNDVKIETLDSASIRLDKKGLRFYTKVDAAKIADLQAKGATVEAGTLIGPADLNPDALTLNTDPANIVDVKFDVNNKDGYFKEGDFEGIVGTLASIRENNIARNFLARGYVKVTIDGQVYISYSDVTASRSLKTVAQGIKANTAYYDTLPTEFQANVDTWAAAADFGA